MNKLNNKELGEMLRAGFADATPDKANDIIRAAHTPNPAPTVSVTQENLRGKYLKPAALITAAIIVLFGMIYLPIAIQNREVYATVLIESDACIRIDLNRANCPVAISGADNAAAQLAKRIEKGDSLAQAVDNTLDAMRSRGNLSEDSNTVLITADAPENAAQLLKSSFEAAKDSFADDGYIGAILTTVASDDKDILSMAQHYRISVGKAEMIADILDKDRSFRTELLSRLSVNDLNLLTSYRKIRYRSIDVFGVSRGCIAPDAAADYVRAEAGDPDADAEVTLGVDTGGLIYSVVIRADNKVYIYRLDAVNGTVIAVSQGDDLKSAQEADRNTPSPPNNKRKVPATDATEKAGTPDTVIVKTDGGVTDQDTHNDPTTAAKQKKKKPSKQKPDTSPTEKKGSPTAKPKKPSATTAPKATEAVKPEPTSAPKPTEASKPTSAPTQQPKRDPAIFTAGNYLRYNGGIQTKNPLTSAARQISIRRISNGYDTFYNNKNFPYSPTGKQGGISALVCNREQFYRLTGKNDSRYDDSYFKTHALYIYMNRDADYHWIKSVRAAYMNNGTLCIRNSDPVGYFITTDKNNPEQIYTVVYELNKAELTDFVSMVEYTD